MSTGGTAPREERRVITVLFADLVGFTERSEQLDPEDVRALLTTYYGQLRADLEARGGVVDKFIGDAVMAVFGAPVAHEDDPERAVRAALAIRDWARGREDVSLRIGVNTGEALVALDPAATGLGMVAGDMVNTASRIQSAAPADGVLVGETTHRATSGVFEYAEREPVVAKGKSEPLRVWEPLEARTSIAARPLGDAPLVGRTSELASLQAAYDRARDERRPQLVTLVGVPGIGKTRLVRELERLVRGEEPDVTWLEGRSLPYGAGRSLWSLGEMVKSYAGILETDEATTAETKLRAALTRVSSDPTDARWLEGHLRPLVGLAADGTRRDEGQAEAFAAWRRFAGLLALPASLVLVFDDLQWADDGVLAFLEELVADEATGAVLAVATARPELMTRRPDWGTRERSTAIPLTPLTDTETMELVASLASDIALEPGTEEALLRRAEGNPLYAEEFVRMAAGGGRDPAAALPDSVRGIVAARLDLLSMQEKDVLQDAAVVGQVFWLGAVAHVQACGCDVAEQILEGLEAKEYVRRLHVSTVAAEDEYVFRHPLIREVAYEQIPRARRAGRHRLAAEWTAALPTSRAEDRAEMLAHHYLSALEYERATGAAPDDLARLAAGALAEAGDHAFSLHALDVAADRYRRALELSDDRERRTALELALAEVELRAGAVEDAQVRLDTVLETARAHGNAELLARAALARGGVGTVVRDPDQALVALLEEALEAIGDQAPDLRARLLARLAVEVYYVPPPGRREELSDEAVRLARECGATDALSDALNARHAALWSPDRLAERLAVAKELIELAEGAGDRERSLQARTWLVLDLVEAGDLHAARREIDEYARLAEPLGIPAFSWWVPAWQAMLACVEGRFDDVLRLSAEAGAIGDRGGDSNAALYRDLVRWHADLEQGRAGDEWLPMIEDGIVRGNPAGAYTCGLAWHHAVAGRIDEAKRALQRLGTEGLASVPRDMNWLTGSAEYCEAVAMTGDAERARDAYPILLPYADRFCLMARAATCHGPAASFLGLLAATAGMWDEAERHFLDALEAAERTGARASAARARGWYADLLRARGDVERANDLARLAESEAGAMGLALRPLRLPAGSVQERA